MRPLLVPDAEDVILGLQDEIRRSEDARYDHRLHGLLLVAQGLTCPEVGRLLGDAPRTVEYWVRRFERRGLAGLSESARPGRPSRLNAEQLEQVEAALRASPMTFGLSTKELSRSLLKMGESGSDGENLRNPLLQVNGLVVLAAQGNDEGGHASVSLDAVEAP